MGSHRIMAKIIERRLMGLSIGLYRDLPKRYRNLTFSRRIYQLLARLIVRLDRHFFDFFGVFEKGRFRLGHRNDL